MKTKISFLLALVVICLAFSFSACESTGMVTIKSGKVKTDDGEFNWSLSDDGCLSYEGTGTVEPVPVEKSKVKSVDISSGFVSIGNNAFNNMNNLSEVNIPDSIQKIGEKAFENCTNLDKIQIPESIHEIAISAFDGWNVDQQILADWYEGGAEYWKEWYDYEKEFGEIADILRNGGEISDEMKCRLSAWWGEWKDSKYWSEAQDYVQKGLDSIETNFDYWKQFGEYIVSNNESAIPEFEWWSQAKQITSYLEGKSLDENLDIPVEIQDIVNANKEDIENAIQYIKEKAKTITKEEVRGYADQIADLWKNYFGS